MSFADIDLPAVISAGSSLLKAVTWPGVALLGLYWYRNAISKFLDRMTEGEAGPAGVKVKATQVPNLQQLNDKSPEKSSEQVEPISNSSSLPLADNLLDGIGGPVLQKIKEIHVGNTDAQLLWLTRIYAIASLERHFEETHRLIFGSQLSLVYRINSAGGMAPVELAEQIYHQACRDFPNIYSNVTFELWLGFVIIRDIISKTSINGSQFLSINESGKRYLKYIVEKQLPERVLG